MEDLSLQIGVMQQEIKDIGRRMDNMEKLTDSIHDMAVSIAEMTANLKSMREHVEQLREDMDDLKTKPARRWEAVVAALIAGIVGAFVGRLFK